MSDFRETDRIAEVRLLGAEALPLTPEHRQELDVALYDLAEENRFRPEGPASGPFALEMAYGRGQLTLLMRPAEGAPVDIALEVRPFRAAIEEHAAITEAYLDGVRRLPPSEIAEIDARRKSVHDTAAEALRAALAPRAATDHATARRLFTVLCALAARP